MCDGELLPFIKEADEGVGGKQALLRELPCGGRVRRLWEGWEAATSWPQRLDGRLRGGGEMWLDGAGRGSQPSSQPKEPVGDGLACVGRQAAFGLGQPVAVGLSLGAALEQGLVRARQGVPGLLLLTRGGEGRVVELHRLWGVGSTPGCSLLLAAAAPLLWAAPDLVVRVLLAEAEASGTQSPSLTSARAVETPRWPWQMGPLIELESCAQSHRLISLLRPWLCLGPLNSALAPRSSSGRGRGGTAHGGDGSYCGFMPPPLDPLGLQAQAW